MANVSHWTASWGSMARFEMAPGDVHHWSYSPVRRFEAISITAHPIVGNPNEPHRTLSVENIQIVGEPQGLGLAFTVKNVGPSFIIGYTVAFGLINA